MKIDKAQVRHVVQLSRLSMSDEKMEALMSDMNDILDYMDLLNELDTTGVEPTSHAMEVKNVFRDDVVRPSLPKDKSMKNAPEQNRGSFVVPRII